MYLDTNLNMVHVTVGPTILITDLKLVVNTVLKNVFGREIEHSSCNRWSNHINHNFKARVDLLTHLNELKKNKKVKFVLKAQGIEPVTSSASLFPPLCLIH